jgi:hypothetical protein
VKTGGNQSNWLVSNFRLYRNQEGNGRVDLSSHWLAVGQDETAGLSYDHRVNQQETKKRSCDGPEKVQFGWSMKKTIKTAGVCWAGNCVREKGEVNESQACSRDDGGEVAEGSQDIRVAADECPERAYFGFSAESCRSMHTTLIRAQNMPCCPA